MIVMNLMRTAKLTMYLMLYLALTSGCAKSIPPTVNIIAAVNAIPCRDLKAITYAAPHFVKEADAENQIDTTQTIEQIVLFNAAYDVACGVNNEQS